MGKYDGFTREQLIDRLEQKDIELDNKEHQRQVWRERAAEAEANRIVAATAFNPEMMTTFHATVKENVILKDDLTQIRLVWNNE